MYPDPPQDRAKSLASFTPLADSRFTGGVTLGTGIGLRVPHYRHILSEKPAVDWFEIISENFMVDGGRPLEVLDWILDQCKVVMHGGGLDPGNAGGLGFDHPRRSPGEGVDKMGSQSRSME